MKTNLSLVNTDQNELSMWDDCDKLGEIRKLFAPKLSDMEFKFFVGLGKASRLNPFTREIWAVKYQENTPAQVFIGRDGYRKAAQAHSDYDFHQCDAVYENDEFEVVNGEVHHKYKLIDRGALIGAYCIAKRHKSSRPMYVFTELKEYATGKSLWNPQTGKPATMIKKVAESQCLRACFQDLLGGTYGEEEYTQEEPRQLKIIEGETNTQKLKTALGIGELNEKEIMDCAGSHESGGTVFHDTSASCDYRADDTKPTETVGDNHDKRKSVPVSETQLVRIVDLLSEKGFNQERVKKAFDYYKINNIDELDSASAEHFLSQLERI